MLFRKSLLKFDNFAPEGLTEIITTPSAGDRVYLQLSFSLWLSDIDLEMQSKGFSFNPTICWNY